MTIRKPSPQSPNGLMEGPMRDILESVEQVLAAGRAVRGQAHERARVFRPDLLQEEPIHQPRRFDHRGEGIALVGRQAGQVHADVDGRESGDLGFERGGRHWGLRGGLGRAGR